MTASAQWQPFTLIGACFIYRPWACYYMICVENIIIMPADVVKKGCIDHWCGSLPQSCPLLNRLHPSIKASSAAKVREYALATGN